MNTSYDPFELQNEDLGRYGYARARDLAFDAVRELWDLRCHEGMTQAMLASKIGRDPAWLNRNLRGPGNWTLRTLGEFVAALNGILEIRAIPAEKASSASRQNSHAYQDYEITSPTTNVNTFYLMGSVAQKAMASANVSHWTSL
jgi:hypothetical protein